MGNLIVFTTVLTGLFFTFFSDISIADDKFQFCPDKTVSAKLSNDKTISLPLCADRSLYISTLALGDLEKANEILAPLNLKAIPTRGKSIFSLSAIEYKRSTLGTFKEFIVALMATPKNNPSTKFKIPSADSTPDPQQVAVALKVWTSESLAMLAGNEIWRFDKEMASIDLSSQYGFSIKDSTGQLIVNSRWENPSPTIIPLAQQLSFYLVNSSGELAPTYYQGVCRFERFQSPSTLNFGNSKWGQILTNMNLKPWVNISIPNIKIQLHPAKK